MRIDLKKFGEILISRPAGKEAFNIIKSYFRPGLNEVIELDFAGVKVMAPSWLDEVYTGLTQELGHKVVFLNSQNSSVIESIKIITEVNP